MKKLFILLPLLIISLFFTIKPTYAAIASIDNEIDTCALSSDFDYTYDTVECEMTTEFITDDISIILPIYYINNTTGVSLDIYYMKSGAGAIPDLIYLVENFTLDNLSHNVLSFDTSETEPIAPDYFILHFYRDTPMVAADVTILNDLFLTSLVAFTLDTGAEATSYNNGYTDGLSDKLAELNSYYGNLTDTSPVDGWDDSAFTAGYNDGYDDGELDGYEDGEAAGIILGEDNVNAQNALWAIPGNILGAIGAFLLTILSVEVYGISPILIFGMLGGLVLLTWALRFIRGG